MKTLLLCLFLSATTLLASGLQPAGIRFAGMWYTKTQNPEEVARQFPVGRHYGDRRELATGAAATSETYSDLTRQILQAIEEKKQEGGSRILDHIDLTASTNYVLACALNYEVVDTQQLKLGKNDIYKLTAEVGFNLIICDFQERSIVASIPGFIQIIDADKGTPTEERKEELVRHLYENRLVDTFLKLAERPWDKIWPSRVIGIDTLSLGENARKQLPPSLSLNEDAYFSSLISSSFADYSGVYILPYSGGNDLVFYSMREMTAQSSDLSQKTAEEDATEEDATGGARSYVLRKPDYKLDILLETGEQIVGRMKGGVEQCAFVGDCKITLKDAGGQPLYTSPSPSPFTESVQALRTRDTRMGSPWIYYDAALRRSIARMADKLARTKETYAILEECRIEEPARAIIKLSEPAASKAARPAKSSKSTRKTSKKK